MARRLEWQLGTVVEVRQETPRAKSLILDVPNWTAHLAGQHVDVRLTAEDGYEAQRSYSIASPPEDKLLTLTIDRIEGGEVSPYLTDELRVGDRVELRGPIGGYFVWDGRGGEGDGSPLFLAAGGSGIAPLRAMLRHRANSGVGVPTRLLYSSRSYEEIIFREELDRLSADDPTLRVIHTLTRRRPPEWAGYGRRIDLEMLADTAWPAAENPLAFACGPTALVEAVADYLLELGYEPERIKTERFGPTGG
ncbi:MAG TPA: ferredoxin reductase [Pyrinomonadaceae bacterium]|jgi:ferredoxin-NADP reductase|nr:ferredoxin reductase [Pyrinomonadaceae bacterium]